MNRSRRCSEADEFGCQAFENAIESVKAINRQLFGPVKVISVGKGKLFCKRQPVALLFPEAMGQSTAHF